MSHPVGYGYPLVSEGVILTLGQFSKKPQGAPITGLLIQSHEGFMVDGSVILQATRWYTHNVPLDISLLDYK